MPHEYPTGADTPGSETTLYRPAGTLTVIFPEMTGGSVVVDPAGTVLGRDTTCDLVLPSEHVSRRHVRVRADGDEYLVEDLDSRNGTVLNGRPVMGRTPLADGDRLTMADVEVEFGLRRMPSASGQVRDRAGTIAPQSLRQELQAAPGFSTRALLLAVAGSVVGAIVTTAAGTGPWGSLTGAALAPVIGTTFSTRRTGEKGRVRTAAIALLSVGAISITWTGFSIADLVAGDSVMSVLPGTAERATTFPAPNADTDGHGGGNGRVQRATDRAASQPAPTNGIGFVVTDAECGTVDVGSSRLCSQSVTVKSTGTRRLHITSVEVTGEHAGDFTAGMECVDAWLAKDETCTMTVRFLPSAAGPRRATVVVHQNLPPPDRGTRVSAAGVGAGEPNDGDLCKEGYTWREAVPGDHVCVSPETHAQAQQDNSLAEERRSSDDPDTCLDGYVRREAVPGDRVCVSPGTRDRTLQDNGLAASRRAGTR